MRLDVFLKTSRLVLRRSIAKELCDAGQIKVNGAAAKASKEVGASDVIDIQRGNRFTAVRILRIPEAKQVSRQESGTLYEIIEERVTNPDDIFY